MVVEDKFSSSARGRQFLAFNPQTEQNWQGSFTFVQAADTQFGMQENYIEKKSPCGWEPEKLWSRQLVQQVNMMQPKPRFLVICGDLLNAWPETEAETRADQEKDFKSIFSFLEVPCVCVCGNHDVGNQPSMESVSRYRSSFGDDFYSFWCGGVFFLVLNSQYYEDSSRVPQLAADQEAWLEGQLRKIKRTKPKHAVIFQHIPLFLNDPQEKKEYFNFSEDLRRVMLDKFYEAGVRHIFSGHYHRNAGGTFKDLQMVVTSAAGAQLGDDEPGYRIVNVTETSITHQYRNLNTYASIPSAIAVLFNVLDDRKREMEEATAPTTFMPRALPSVKAK